MVENVGKLKPYRKPRKKKSLKQIERDSLYIRIYDEYIKAGGTNIKEAVRVFYPDKSESNLSQIGKNVLESEAVRKVVVNRNKKRVSRSYLSVEERKSFLSEVILGEREPDAKTMDRLKAVQILNNMEGIGTQQILQQQNIQVNQISLEEKRAIVNERLNEILGGWTTQKISGDEGAVDTDGQDTACGTLLDNNGEAESGQEGW